MITFKALWKSARVRSLPLSVSGIIMGSGMVYGTGDFRWEVFLLALLTTLLYQVISDYANDYGDGEKGTDNEERVGPQRAIQSGDMSLAEMKKVIKVLVGVALGVSVVLLVVAFGVENWLYILMFFVLALACVWAAIKYTVGSDAYGYKGYADVFVFVFFGLVSVVGSNFLYVKTLSWEVFLPASSVGLLSTAVLNLNNMRDVENDARMGKRTLVVRMGVEVARYYHYILVLLAMVLMMGYSLVEREYGTQVIYMIAFVPLLLHLRYVKKCEDVRRLDSQLKVVAMSTFVMSVLFFVGEGIW